MTKKRYFYNGKRCSKGEKKIAELLNQYNINFKKEHFFADLKSEKGNPLRFDFFLPDHNILIEYQGEHHYKPINKYKRAQKTHNLTKYHDNLKQNYVNDIDGLHLLSIPYTFYNHLDELFIKLIKKLNKKE